MAAVALVALTACGSPDGNGDAVSQDPQTQPQQATADDAPPAAQGPRRSDGQRRDVVIEELNVDARTLNGGTVTLAEVAGPPLVLWMWAPW